MLLQVIDGSIDAKSSVSSPPHTRYGRAMADLDHIEVRGARETTPRALIDAADSLTGQHLKEHLAARPL